MGGIICKHGERSNVYSRCVREKKAREFVIFVKITKKRDVDKAKGEERKGGEGGRRSCTHARVQF